MASTNLDVVRSLYAAWERGDWSSVEWAHPEIELIGGDGPDPGGVRGLAAMGAFWREFLGAWEGYRVEAEEYRELDDERVLVFIRIGGRGKSSGLDVGQLGKEAANLVHLRERKVTKLVLYWDRQRALADTCLGAEGGSARSRGAAGPPLREARPPRSAPDQ